MQDEMIIQKNEMNANVKGGGLHYSNIIKKAFGEDVISKYSFLKTELQFFMNCRIPLEEEDFLLVFNPKNGEAVIRETLSGLRVGILIDAYRSVLEKDAPSIQEAAEVRLEHALTERVKEVSEKMEKAVGEASLALEEARKSDRERHEAEMARVREIYDEQISGRRKEILEDRERFVSYVNTEMDMIRQMMKEQREVSEKLVKLYGSYDVKSKEEYDRRLKEQETRLAEERVRLQEEFHGKLEEYRNTIASQKEEIHSLNEKLRIHMEETMSIREEKAKLSAWNEIYESSMLEKTKQLMPLEEPGKPVVPEKRGRFGGRKKQATSGQKEMVSILCMKEVSDEQAEALVEAWKKGASIEKIREVAQANVSVERIRLMFDIDQILNGGESK